MEFQALHGLAKKLLGVDAIRSAIVKELNEDPVFQGLQQELQQDANNSSRSTGLRRRLPAARTVSAIGEEEDDVHVDTWTEASTAPGSPQSDDQDRFNETLGISSGWDDSDFELLPGPRSAARDDTAPESESAEADKGSLGQRLSQWLHACSQSIARVVGGVCRGAMTLAKGIVKDCSKLLQDVASWCKRSIDEIRRRAASMPRWVKITGGVVAVALLMGAIVMMLIPPPPPHLLPGLL